MKKKSNVPSKMKPDYVACNTGEQLYHRSRINKEKMSRLAQKEIKQKEKEEPLNYSFKPEINDFEHKFLKRSYKVPIADCLKEIDSKVQEDLRQKREEHKKKKEEDYTFAPKLNPLSLEITSKLIKRDATEIEKISLQTPDRCERFNMRMKKEQEEKEEMERSKKSKRGSTFTSSYKGRSIDELVYSRQATLEDITTITIHAISVFNTALQSIGPSQIGTQRQNMVI